MNITELCEQLRAVDARVDSHLSILRRERDYIQETMEKTQTSFGDQTAGQHIVYTLFDANNKVGAADSALDALKTQLDHYLNQICQ